MPATDFIVDPDTKHYRFNTRPAAVLSHERTYTDMKARFDDMVHGNFRFRIGSGCVSPHTGLRAAYNRNGEAEPEQQEDTPIWIAFETISPLFDTRITVAERMLCHFKLGVSIMHELCVSQSLCASVTSTWVYFRIRQWVIV
jgi:hypothetical protein